MPESLQGAVRGEGGFDRFGVGGGEAGFGEGGLAGGVGRVIAVERGEGLEELGAAAVAVHVAEAADVHEDIELEAGADVEGAEELVVAAAVLGAEGDEFGAAGGGQGGDLFAELAVGVVAVRVEKGCGEFDFGGLVGGDEVDDGGGSDGLAGHEFGGGLREERAGGALVVVRDGVLDEGGGGFDGRGGGVGVPGGGGGGVAEFFAEGADFGEVAGEEAGDLGFEGAGVDDLAERGVGGEGEEVAGDVEGAGLEGAGVGVLLHGVRAGDALGEGGEHVLAEVLVASKRAWMAAV